MIGYEYNLPKDEGKNKHHNMNTSILYREPPLLISNPFPRSSVMYLQHTGPQPSFRLVSWNLREFAHKL